MKKKSTSNATLQLHSFAFVFLSLGSLILLGLASFAIVLYFFLAWGGSEAKFTLTLGGSTLILVVLLLLSFGWSNGKALWMRWQRKLAIGAEEKRVARLIEQSPQKLEVVLDNEELVQNKANS